MTHDQINDLNLEDVIDEVVNRIFGRPESYVILAVDDSGLLSIDENFYNKLSFTNVERPPLPVMLDLLFAIKEEKRLVRDAEIMGVVSDYNAVSGYLVATGVKAEDISQYLIDKAREEDLDFFNLTLVQEETKFLNRRRLSKLVDVGSRVDQLCKEVLNIVIGLNVAEKSLTSEQIKQLRTIYAPIKIELNEKQPMEAYKLLAATEPDGVLYTQEDKDMLMDYLIERKSELGL